MTGLFYDAVDRKLYINSRIGNNFQCFLSTETGFGLAGLKNGKPFLEVVYGDIPVDEFVNNTTQ
jgi:hypothetical protein